jgi:two-component system chemotaxis response regulator CheB
MAKRDSPDPDTRAGPAGGLPLVVIAASAGGLKPITAVLASLAADFPAPVAVLQHRSPSLPDLLAGLLADRTEMRVRNAGDGDRPEPGTVYICPAGAHMTAGQTLSLHLTERANASSTREGRVPRMEELHPPGWG